MVVAPQDEFETLTDRFRRWHLADCYRMLGSIQDAEDQVQEVYIRAWRSFDQFEGRSSLRVDVQDRDSRLSNGLGEQNSSAPAIRSPATFT